MQNTAAAAETRKRRRYRCECGQDLTGLSDYHVSEHKRSARHRKALDAAKTPRLDSFFRWKNNTQELSEAESTAEADLVIVESDHIEVPVPEEITACSSDSLQNDNSMIDADNSMIYAESTCSTEVLNDNVSHTVLSPPPTNKCQGFHPNIPQPFTLNYPFQLHNFFSLPFTFTQSAIFSTNCCGVAEVGKSNCLACSSLSFNKSIKEIESRANVCSKFANNHFLTYTQLVDKLSKMREQRDHLRLTSFNCSRKLTTLAKSVDVHKRLLWCLSENDISRLRQVLSVCFEKGASVNYMLDRIQLALDGVYHAKGFRENDIDLGLLVLRIGGPRLVHALHHVYGLPSISLLYKQQAAKFTPSVGCYERDILWKNLSTMVLAVDQGEPCCWVLMIDEVACEQRVRWNAEDNKLYGICREHSNRISLAINTVDDVQVVADAVQQGIVHLSTEITVIAVAALRETGYTAFPLLALPSCKADTAESQREMVNNILTEWKDSSQTASLGPIVLVATDGDPKRRLGFDQLLRVDKPSQQISAVLNQLTLMDTAVGESDIVVHFDDKHVIKRLREVLKSYSRGSVIHKVKITGAVIKRFLEKMNLPNVNQLLHPEDSQNVPLAVSLLKAVAQLFMFDGTLTPSEEVILCEVKVLSFICNCLVSYLFDTTFSLSEQLVMLSSLSHTLLVLYRRNATKFVPSQWYHDCQAMIKCVYVITIRMQQQFPDQPLYLFQLGTDRLEGLFSVLRTLTHNSNFDMLQCGERLAHATQIAQLYQKHPDWKRASKRLQGSEDHMNPTSWAGSTSTKDVDVQQCWLRGRMRAFSFLHRTQFFTDDELDFDTWSSEGCSMMCPRGSVVGVQLDQDNEEEDENDNEQGTSALYEDLSDVADIEDVLPSDERGSNGFIQFEGRMVHKASVVRILFSSDPKSGDRLRRVRGMSKHNSSTFNGNTEDDCLLVGDPCGTLVRTSRQICFALFLVNSISNSSGTKVSSLAISDLSQHKVKVSGPIMVLTQTESTEKWTWNRSLGGEIHVSGPYAQVVNPDILTLPDDSERLTYSFSDLSALCEILWSKSGEQVSSLAFTNCNSLPYQNSMNEPSFISAELDPALSTDSKQNFLTCKLCRKEIKTPQMRLHIGFHILTGDCVNYPCGFCGIASTCSIELKKTSQHHKGPHSDCEYFYKFSLNSASKGTARSPCTNVPMLCTICQQVHWKYNMAAHFTDRHEQSDMPSVFSISSNEKTKVLSVGKFSKAKINQ